MLTIPEISAMVTATKGPVDLFDRLAGPIKRALLPDDRYEQVDAKDQRWRFKVGAEGENIVVKENGAVRQTISGAELATKLDSNDLALIQTYEQKMQYWFTLWQAVYAQSGTSPDALKNAQTDAQLKDLVLKMRGELLGILSFLERLGVQLDDHYLNVRSLVECA
jgi:DNA polymerase I-like protein with 3'-5' exonuclease and polymerase domains